MHLLKLRTNQRKIPRIEVTLIVILKNTIKVTSDFEFFFSLSESVKSA